MIDQLRLALFLHLLHENFITFRHYHVTQRLAKQDQKYKTKTKAGKAARPRPRRRQV